MSGRRLCTAAVLAAALVVFVTGCGGGGGDGGTPASVAPASSGVVYAQSQVLGLAGAQSLTYQPAAGTTAARVQVAARAGLLAAGDNVLTAEYVAPSLADLRVACVSGDGSNIGVLAKVNAGVTSVSAAVLMGAAWREVDPAAAWAAASGRMLTGWENCGVKPEGRPYPSSMVTVGADGGYAEDLYIGNPGTNFTTVRQNVGAAEAAAMRGTGALVQDDPSRPLRITWRAFADATGHTVWIERAEPAPGAAGTVQGFITLFLPN